MKDYDAFEFFNGGEECYIFNEAIVAGFCFDGKFVINDKVCWRIREEFQG